jgi:Ca-activated chloride channel family protein
VSAPVLTDVKLEVQSVRVEDLYPYPLPDLFAGNQLVIAGRYRQGGPATIRLSGLVNGQLQNYAYIATFAGRGGDDFIARLWAQRKIGYLLAQIRLSGVKDELVKEIVALSTRYGIVTPYTSFLVQEPQLALTQGGRDQLSQGAAAPAPTSATGRALEPGKAPAAGLVPQVRAGEAAVDRAVVESQLQASEQAAAPAVQQLRQVGDKTFLFSQNAWLDTAFDATRMQAEAVVFGSDRYFQLLGQYPEIGRYLALGDRVTLVLSGKAFAVGSAGQPGAQPGQATATSLPTATQRVASATLPAAQRSVSPSPTVAQRGTAVIAAQSTTAPAPSPQLKIEGTPIVADQPAPAPTAGQAAPPVCTGAGLIGLIALLLPMWVWQRRGM